MKKLLMLGCLFVVFMGVAALATADTITTSSCNVDFAVNDGGSFYVRSSRIVPAGSPPGLDASAFIAGSTFDLIANSTGYSDAAIVLYFNGGLKLGDLKSASVVSSGSPVSINLWLDTGGDGKFFAFDGNGLMTGLNGDSYGSHSGASLDATSSFYMMGGNGVGQTYTLAQLQSGVVPGINSNTGAALWIGITNNGSADISSVAVWTAAENALQNGGDRLAATQNTDGGWGWPLTGASAPNTNGPIAMGLAKAYSHTGSANQLAALQKAGVFFLAKTNTFTTADGYEAAELDRIFGGNTYINHIKTNFYDMLAAGTYYRNDSGTVTGPYTTSGFVTFLRNRRASQNIPNLSAWDLGMGLVSAASCSAGTSEWIAGVKAEINELDGNLQYDVIGLAGAVYGLAFVHEDFDPTAGEHAAAASVNDLAAILAGYQINNGGFPERKNSVVAVNQETSYAILALNEVNRPAYLNNIQGASNYLAGTQMSTGGWNGDSETGTLENNEETGEALWGISTVHILTNTCSHTVTSSAGANGNIDPLTAQTITHNATTSFTVAPNANYHAVMSGTCGGTLVGNTYTTDPVTADCSVTANFAIDTHTVTPSAGANGNINPSTAQTLSYNATPSFTVTPAANYHAVMSGTCGGTLVGNTYTTDPVTADCSVTANFAIDTHTVYSSAGANGTINPSYIQTVDHNATPSFTVTPAANYHAVMSGTCGGTLVGNTYTTNPITVNCTVTASFVVLVPLDITTSSLPSGLLLNFYSQTLTATGGLTPYTWSVSAGALPDGLTLNSSTGEISGTPTTSGTFSFTVQAMDAIPSTAFRNLSITIGSLPVRYGDPTAPINYDQIIQSAYDQCTEGYIIQVQALEFPANDIFFDRPLTITLQGGFDEGFTGNPSFTTITGKLVISNGSVIVENIVIR